MRRTAVVLVAAVLLVAGCSGSDDEPRVASGPPSSRPPAEAPPTTAPLAPPAPDPAGIYQFTGPEDMNPSVAGIPSRVYVPNSDSNTVSVIDPATFEVVDKFRVGREPQHVAPSWDLKTLYVTADLGNTLTPIDPKSGTPGTPIDVEDPYNLYFTPDGKTAIVVAERFRRLDFRNPNNWELIESVSIPYDGVDHLDFSADGKTLLASCEFSGYVARVDVEQMKLTGALKVGGSPVDVKLSPDGSVMYVANQQLDGVSVVDPNTMAELEFIPTGKGAHGLYPSRDAKVLYVSNRLAGSVSVIDFATRKVVATWEFGGSPDMGGVTIDGSQLWLSGRYDSEIYVLDTRNGEVIKRIAVEKGPHGLAVFPQPGRYSMGHTGNYR